MFGAEHETFDKWVTLALVAVDLQEINSEPVSQVNARVSAFS
jgi:hypothetical protein